MALAAISCKAVVKLLICVHCFSLGVCVWALICHAVLSILYKKEKELEALLLLSHWCLLAVNVICPILWSAVCNCVISWSYSRAFYSFGPFPCQLHHIAEHDALENQEVR